MLFLVVHIRRELSLEVFLKGEKKIVRKRWVIREKEKKNGNMILGDNE